MTWLPPPKPAAARPRHFCSLSSIGCIAEHAAHRRVVLAPTRELAAQMRANSTARPPHPAPRAVVVGGESMGRQIDRLRKGAQVLVACPGRLIDHHRARHRQARPIEVVVIDEADRLLDMGFLPQLRRIMKMVPKQRQTLMFSATMGPVRA